jgi:hypothetical protein
VQIKSVEISQGVMAAKVDGSGSLQTPPTPIDVDGDGVPDLVASRGTLARVMLDRRGSTDTSPITVNVTSNGVTLGSGTTTTAQPNQVDITFDTPAEAGKVQTDITATIGGSTTSDAVKVDIIPVRLIKYVYFAVNGLRTGSVAQAGVTLTAQESQGFIEGVYPVGDLVYDVGDPHFDDQVPGFFNFDLIVDSTYCWFQRSLTGAERCVAIVTPDWFKTYVPEAIGFTPTWSAFGLPMIKDIVFSGNGDFATPAHELGHSYNILGGPDMHTTDMPASGYWFAFSADVNPNNNSTTLDYMNFDGDPALNYPSTMAAASMVPNWSTSADFSYLFKKFAGFTPDPEVLLVAGTIGKNNVVQFSASYRSQTGSASVSESGDGELRVKDSNGNVVAELTFPVSFAVDDGAGTIDPAPFLFSVPYPKNAATVEFVRSGKVVASFSPTTKLLDDAVLSIPDSGFDQNPAQRRNALLNKISALNYQLSAGDITGALNNLRNDILKNVQSWLVDGYATESPLQYTKQQILDLIAELIQRIGGQGNV